MKHIQPVANRLLIEPEEVSSKKGNIYIPDTAVDKPQKGRIIACGPDCKQAKVGNDVIWTKYIGAEIEVEGRKLIIMKEDNAHLIVTTGEETE
jgi:chaperonin GroES